MIKWVSMFSSAWIAETYFEEAWIDIVVASELLSDRWNFYQARFPKSKMVIWDINDKTVKSEFMNNIPKDAKFLIATPPCQWASTLGVNKSMNQMVSDQRNYLIFSVFDVIEANNFDYIMIENVPRFLQVFFPYKWKFETLETILNDKYQDKYTIEIRVLNAKDYWVPQTRPRAIIKMYKKWLKRWWPKEQKEITLKEAIWHLPSLESWEKSDLKYHYAKIHNKREIEAIKHTQPWKSALTNEIYYPKKTNWERIKWFHNTYKRMVRDAPAPARTMNNWNIWSHNNVHPWRLLPDWTYSDARVLSLRELFIVSSLPEEWNIPEWYSDAFIRKVIWEAIPPKLSFNIVKEIWNA